MGTLAKALQKVRLRIKDQKKTEFADSELLDLTIDIMDQVFKKLKRMESNLLIKSGSIQCVAGTSTYTFAEAKNLVDGGVWIDNPDSPLVLSMRLDDEADNNRPEKFALPATGEIKFLPTPNADYLVNTLYFEDYVVPTEDTLATYDFPWSGIWDAAIERSLVMECLAILERSISMAAILAGDAWDEATMETYTHGHIVRSKRGRMFYGL